MIKQFIIISVLGCFLATVNGQFVTNYKRAGDQFYAKGDYYSAAQYYEKYVGGKTPGNAGYEPYLVQKQGAGESQSAKKETLQPELVYKLANSYYQLHDFSHAEPWYKMLTEKYEAQYPQARYWYATCLRANGQLDAAGQELEKFVSDYKANDEFSKKAKQELDTWHFIQQQLSNPANGGTNTGAKVEKLNGNINKEGANYAAGWPDDKTLVFTSTRTGHTNALYSAEWQNGGLGEAGKLSMPAIKDRQVGTASFSPDGARMYYTGWMVNKEGKKISAVYLSEKNNNGWDEPVLIDGSANGLEGVNSRQPHVTADGKYLLLASDRSGGLGGFDIWYTELDKDGRPGKMVNMGPAINTAEDEEAPFYHAGSHTLVVASKGRTGMGGFDLFASVGSFGGPWSNAMNLGHPVNSVKDDSYFTGKGKWLLEDVLISSDRSSVCCLELFAVHKNYKQYVSGQVTDCATQLPLSNVRITAIDVQGNRIAEQSTGEQGKYLIEADAGVSLQISGQISGYENGQVRVSDPAADTVYASMLCLTKVPDPFKGQETLVTHDIYFEFAKASITPASHEYLDKVAAYLKANPDIRLELGAHTDGIGSTKSNLVLSQGRADACVQYLVSAGAAPGQLIAKGYGECCPLEKETVKGKDNPAAREKNRRVEFKILK